MTKNEFINFLNTSLDFLNSIEKENVLDFFQEKFSFCTTIEEESAVIEAFGSPELLIERIQNDKAKSKKPLDFKSYLETAFRASISALDSQNSDGDLIFSKPLSVEKSSKVVHSMEDHEVKTLYGEKVVVEGRVETKVKTIEEPIDEANGLTTEEIRIAKKKTLEKTEAFTDEAPKIDEDPAETDPSPATSIPLEEEACDDPSEKKSKQTAKKEFFGLFNRILPNGKFKKSSKMLLLILLTLAVSPIILAAFGFVLTVYAALVGFTALVVCALFALMIGSIAIGVVELVHGFLVLFDSVAAALIELGFGTVLFSFVIAIAALIHEFIFALVPKWIKWITKIFVRHTKFLYCYLYGGKA